MSDEETRLVVIAGPTASGKSALGWRVARRLGGAVINADALQLYADLKVLSARPDDGPASDPPHHLYGVLDGEDRASAGWWARTAGGLIEDMWREGRTPVLVGGTGLYLKSLIEGLSPIPKTPTSIVEAAKARLRAVGHAAFRDETRKRDPDAVAAVAAGDTQRLLRIWSVKEATGATLTAWRGEPAIPAVRPDRVDAFVLQVDRAELHSRCDVRFDRMLAAGALDEVHALLDRGLSTDLPVMKAVGVPPLLDHLAGRIALEEAVETAKRDTRRYAKRQETWFRNQAPQWRRLMGNDGAADEIFASLDAPRSHCA